MVRGGGRRWRILSRGPSRYKDPFILTRPPTRHQTTQPKPPVRRQTVKPPTAVAVGSVEPDHAEPVIGDLAGPRTVSATLGNACWLNQHCYSSRTKPSTKPKRFRTVSHRYFLLGTRGALRGMGLAVYPYLAARLSRTVSLMKRQRNSSTLPFG